MHDGRIRRLEGLFSPGPCPNCGWEKGQRVAADPNDLFPYMPEDDLRDLTDILLEAQERKDRGDLPLGPGRNRAGNAAARRAAEDV